jgi:anti-sigma B factor antagonist
MKFDAVCSLNNDTNPEQRPTGLQLEVRHRGQAVVVHCKGRIVYRNEAAALSQEVGELLDNGQVLVLDFTGVEAIDSAGLGELVLLHMRSQSVGRPIKLANPNQRVRHLLEITNLTSILDLYPTLDAAIDAPSSARSRRYRAAANW